ncbi:hypothetical protein Y1Q_0009782 [Alligator mississippiensis]|uniref:Uncharacterized protein n=1 Tax=Alligator mississippiensis TaxID=8496 RepID=A0A151MWR7_ALLMI|nr:hypothetical protein Y1Q_0009782 [Alligator mississippiensis]
MLQRSEKGITLKVTLKYFCHRLIRIQPLHMYSICLLVGLYSVTSWGSLWEISKFQVDNCRQLWWSNLLLLNNFISVTESCNGWTWYLANDFQFYLTTPLVIFLYTRSKHGLIVLGIILLLATFTVTGLLSAFFRLPVASPSDMSVAGLERVIQESQKEDVKTPLTPTLRLLQFIKRFTEQFGLWQSAGSFLHVKKAMEFYLFLGHCLATFITGLVLTVLVEKPFENLKQSLACKLQRTVWL